MVIDAVEQTKPNVNSANESPLDSNFGLMVYKVAKAQKLVSNHPTIYFNVSINHLVT